MPTPLVSLSGKKPEDQVILSVQIQNQHDRALEEGTLAVHTPISSTSSTPLTPDTSTEKFFRELHGSYIASTPIEKCGLNYFLKKLGNVGALSAPLYSASNKFIINTVAWWRITGNPWLAIGLSAGGAISNAIVQYHFSAKGFLGSKELIHLCDEERPKTTAQYAKDEALAVLLWLSSVTEGIEFGFGTFTIGEVFGWGIAAKSAAAATAFIARQRKTLIGDGHRHWMEHVANGAPRFEELWAGWFAIKFTNPLPCVLDFDYIITKFQPNFESLLHTAAVKAVLNQDLGWSFSQYVIPAIIAGSGEFFLQKGYDQQFMLEYQKDLSTQLDAMREEARCMRTSGKPVRLTWVIDKLLTFYNAALGNVVNGRILTEPLGILFSPAFLQPLLKIAGNGAMGYEAGQKLVELGAPILRELGLESAADGLKGNATPATISVITVAVLAAVVSYKSGYDKTLHGKPVGAKKELEAVYGNGVNLTGMSGTAITARAYGYGSYVSGWASSVKSAAFTLFNALGRQDLDALDDRYHKQVDEEKAQQLTRQK